MWGSSSGSTVFNTTTTTDLSNNNTLTCAARNIQGPIELPYSIALTITVRAIVFVYFFCIVMCGSSLNLLVIVLVAKYKKLQTSSFAIALQIVALDLLMSLSLSNVLVTSVTNRWVFHEYLCAANGSVTFLAYTVRSYLMLVFVIDRFFLVFCPYFYPKHQFKVTASLFLVSWMFGIMQAIILLPGILDCYTFLPFFLVCGLAPKCSNQCSSFYRMIIGITGIPVTLTPVILYIVLYLKARRMKIQNELVEKRKKEWKATITFFLMFITVFALLLPSSALNFAISLSYRGQELPPAVFVLSLLAASSTHLLLLTDPIFILRNRDVKEVLSKIKVKIKVATCKVEK